MALFIELPPGARRPPLQLKAPQAATISFFLDTIVLGHYIIFSPVWAPSPLTGQPGAPLASYYL